VTVRIGSADSAERVILVGEIGNNHEGDAGVAREMIDVAADAGLDAVKLQALVPERFVRPTDPARLEQMRRFALTFDEYGELAQHARSLGLAFVCTPLDMESADFLDGVVDAVKVASGDNDWTALLRRVAAMNVPVIFSTGMSDWATIEAAERELHETELGILHCVSAYPAPAEDARLATIPELAARFPHAAVGYSDHVLGIDACVAAVALGARVIEKHITLAHDYSDFRDHQLSADPGELRELVRRVRAAQGETTAAPVTPELLGDPRDGVLAIEEPVAAVARRSLVATADLEAGHVLASGDLIAMRPRDGIPPSREDDLTGRALTRAVGRGEPLQDGDVG
jgi:sialic acid synthase SpsE